MQFTAQASTLDEQDDCLRPELRPGTGRVLAVVIGTPLLLLAIAFGLGTDVAAWCAPWALLGAAPFLGGQRIALPLVLVFAPLALLSGPAPFAGLAAGAVAGALAERGVRVSLALPAAPVAAITVLLVLATAWA
jgi:hypothetical protein